MEIAGLAELEVAAAVREVAAAQNRFEYAKPDYVDVATYELLAAEQKLSLLLQEAKDTR